MVAMRTPIFRLLALLLLPLAAPAAGGTLRVNGFEHAPAAAGGSNYHWYALGPGCDREPYGVLANYHLPGVRDLVQAQLRQMRAGGQDRIATGVIHLRAPWPTGGAWTGTLLDSSGGDLHPTYKANLALFLADIGEAGFVQVLFRYFPQGGNDPQYWSAWDEDRYQENWNLVWNLEAVLQASGLDYLTDLGVELMPRARILDLPGYPLVRPEEPANPVLTEYARRLWREYASQFGAGHSVGFSFVSDDDRVRTEARVRHLPTVYTGPWSAGVWPAALALDLYGTARAGEATMIRRHDSHVRGIPGAAALPWIIAEAYYDDAAAAGGVLEGMADTGRQVLWLAQWPLARADACGAGVNQAPPEQFGQWKRRGF